MSTRVTKRGPPLSLLAGKIAGLSGRPFVLGLHQNLAQEARKQLYDEFKGARDPYGRPWARTIRGGTILRDSSRMLNSMRPLANRTGFTITSPVIYAPVHQFGATVRAKNVKALRFKVGGQWVTKKAVVIPRRQYLPERNTGGLGGIWTPAFKNVIKSYVRVFMGKR